MLRLLLLYVLLLIILLLLLLTILLLLLLFNLGFSFELGWLLDCSASATSYRQSFTLFLLILLYAILLAQSSEKRLTNETHKFTALDPFSLSLVGEFVEAEIDGLLFLDKIFLIKLGVLIFTVAELWKARILFIEIISLYVKQENFKPNP